MRHFRFTMTPTGDGFATTDRRIAETADVDRKALLDLDLLTDGTAMAIYLLSGDASALDATLAEASEVVDHHVFNTGGTRFHVLIHFEPDDPLRSLLELAERHHIVMETPLEFLAGGSLRATVGGIQENVQDAAAEFPSNVEVTIQQIGQYDPSRDSLLASLTNRQREVLEVAIREGYYEIPRRATHDDLAAELDCSAGTVGEHLRKIESRVLSVLME